MSDPNPYPPQPQPGQPVAGQPYPGEPYPGQPYAGQPYPGQPVSAYGNPASPYGQPAYPYGQPGYPYGGPSVRYEPLPRRHKRAAFWAGGVGLNLMALGANILGVLLFATLFLALFVGIASSSQADSGLQGLDQFLSEINAPLWGIAVGAVGLIVFLAGMFASVAILQRAQVRRPWAVTWSALAITIIPLGVLNFILSGVVQILSAVGGFGAAATSGDPAASIGVFGVILILGSLLVSIIVVAITGALTWWWMAHAFRERVPLR